MSTSHKVQECSCCSTLARCKQRSFSEEALAMLLIWDEIDVENIDSPICEYCYEDLRDVLIDRASEIEIMHKNGVPEEVQKMIVHTIHPARASTKGL